MIVNIIIELIIPLIGLILTLYFIPFLKEKKVYGYVKIAVQAAQQMWKENEEDNIKKFEYVKAQVQAKFNISDEDVQRLIESAVYELKQAAKSAE